MSSSWPLVLVGAAHAVDAADRGDDDHVAACEQGRRGGVAQAVDLVVDRRVLLDEGVARRDVRLGLVVVVVADEVLDPIVREELAHLLRQLSGEALVGSEDQRRPLDLLDRPRDRGPLAGAGDAEQRLEPVAGTDALGQGGDRSRLIAGGVEIGHDAERLLVHLQLRHCRVRHRSHFTSERSFGQWRVTVSGTTERHHRHIGRRRGAVVAGVRLGPNAAKARSTRSQ